MTNICSETCTTHIRIFSYHFYFGFQLFISCSPPWCQNPRGPIQYRATISIPRKCIYTYSPQWDNAFNYSSRHVDTNFSKRNGPFNNFRFHLRYSKTCLFLCSIRDAEMVLSSLIIMPRVPKDFIVVLLYTLGFIFYASWAVQKYQRYLRG